MVTSQELSFEEYRVLIGNPPQRHATKLWNILAEYCKRGTRRSIDAKGPVAGTLPVDELLALRPEAAAKSVKGIGSKDGLLGKLYGALYYALGQKFPESLPPSLDVSLPKESFVISKSGLEAFSPPGTPSQRIGRAWNCLRDAADTSALTVIHVEAFCTHMAKRQNWPNGFGEPHLELLSAWLRHLKTV